MQFTRKRIFTFEDGQDFEESELHFNTHTGTHVDAPSHFIRDGKSIDQVDLNKFCGKVYVFEHMQNKPIDYEDLAPLKKIRGLRKILFKTLNSVKSLSSFDENFIALTSEAASELANMKIDLIGIDGSSVQLYKDKVPTTHQVLLTNEIAILEGLDLSNVQTGFYTLVALPLKIEKGEGSPVRAVLLEGNL
jgi:arylformamidase